METARNDAVAKFKASQPFIDACAIYYGDKFEDCLQQVKSVYPNLDFSKVTMDEPLPLTTVGDTIFEESDDLTKFEAGPEDDSVVIVQPAVDQPVVSLTSSVNPPTAKDPSTQGDQDLPPMGDEDPRDPLTS